MNSTLPDEYKNLPYRPCVGIILLNKYNHIFVGERLDTPGAWQMPQGGVDPGEDIETAIFRELKEEVGTNDANILGISDQKFRYDIPAERIPKFWNGAYRGQEQTWAALRFTGKDSDINLATYNEPEFARWQWVKPEKTLELIVPFKKELYKNVINAFKHLF